MIQATREGISYWTDEDAARAGIVTAFSERSGGVSASPYDSLNLGLAVGDDRNAVAENRARLCAAVGLGRAAAETLPTITQVHGTDIIAIPHNPISADGLITAVPNQPLLLCFADCVPVILWATKPQRAIAVLHSGWRGTLHEIARAGVDALAQNYEIAAQDIHALIGPYIGPESFAVGRDVWLQFVAAFPTIAGRFVRDTKGEVRVYFDLGEAVSITLARAGVDQGRIQSVGQSTVQHTERYFSYRAADGVCGRIGALACITAD